MQFISNISSLKNLSNEAREVLQEYLKNNYDVDLSTLIDIIEDLNGEDLNDVSNFFS